jgi:hypothetical protein
MKTNLNDQKQLKDKKESDLDIKSGESSEYFMENDSDYLNETYGDQEDFKLENGEIKNKKRIENNSQYYNYANKYVGEFKDGKKNGQGTFYYLDGSKYIGSWQNDKRNGKGHVLYTNGDRFKGILKGWEKS